MKKSTRAKEIVLEDKVTGELYYFKSYSDAAKELKVSREAVRTWAEGIYQSRRYRVLK